jgi:hypothetical protein
MMILDKRLLTAIFTLIAGTCLSGCAATQSVTDPNTITLEHALVDTVDALNAANAEARRNGRFFGYYGCSVTAVYNVSATGTQDNKVTITGSAPATQVIPVSIGGTFSSEANASGTRGNTVTVVFDTKYCFPNGAGTKAGNLKPPRQAFDNPLPSK